MKPLVQGGYKPHACAGSDGGFLLWVAVVFADYYADVGVPAAEYLPMSAATRLAVLLALTASWARIEVGALNPAKDRYAHVSYRFAQHPGGIHGFGFGARTSSLAEEGTGEIWLSWEPVNHVRLRVQGVSESKGMGKILETVYMDSVSKIMYARVEIPKHNLNQCTKFQFPPIQDPFNQQRTNELRDRRNELSNWADHRKHQKDEVWDHRLRVSRLQWSPKKELGLVVTNEGPGDGELLGLQLEEGDDVLKKIYFHRVPDTAPTIPEDKQFLFEHPSDCLWPDEGGTPEEAPVVDLRCILRLVFVHSSQALSALATAAVLASRGDKIAGSRCWARNNDPYIARRARASLFDTRVEESRLEPLDDHGAARAKALHGCLLHVQSDLEAISGKWLKGPVASRWPLATARRLRRWERIALLGYPGKEFGNASEPSQGGAALVRMSRMALRSFSFVE
eukprot:s1722_g2.t1